MYKCDKCGRCCRNLNFNDLYNYLNRGDGVCIYLDELTNSGYVSICPWQE